jgi:hypothetical protein
LGPLDKLAVMWTVGTDLFTGPAVQQAWQTGVGCGSQMITDIETEIETLISNAVNDLVNAAAYLAQAAALRIMKSFLESVTGFQ